MNSRVSSTVHDKRFLVLSCIVLVVISLGLSSLGYLVSFENRTAQKVLEQRYNDLSSEYSSLQNSFQILQSGYINLKTNLTQLQSTYESLKSSLAKVQQDCVSNESFGGLQQTTAMIQSQLVDLELRLNSSASRESLLELQQGLFSSQLGALQGNYSTFLSQYRSLGTCSSFNYLVFCDSSGNYCAENGVTSALDFSGHSGSEVAQNCINSLSNSGGRIVFAGRIMLDKPLVINDNSSSKGLLELCGLGPSTQLVCQSGGDCIDISGSQAFGSGGDYHVSVSDLVLTSEVSPQGNFMSDGICVVNWFDVNIENVMVFYAQKAGIFIQDSANVHLNNVYVEGCSGTEYGGQKPLTGAGFWLQGSKDCYLSQCFSDTNEFGFLFDSDSQTYNIDRSLFLSQCEATLSNKEGISAANTNGIFIANSLVEGSGEDGIMLIDSFQSNVVSSIVSGNSGNGIVVTTESANMSQCQISIEGCTLSGNSKNGIGIWAKNGQEISQINIEDCTVTNSGTGVHGNPNQPCIWDGINIGNDIGSGGRCDYITIANCFIGNEEGLLPTQEFGVRSMQNTDVVQVLACRFFGNMEGNYALVGASNVVKDSSGY